MLPYVFKIHFICTLSSIDKMRNQKAGSMFKMSHHHVQEHVPGICSVPHQVQFLECGLYLMA